MRSLCNILSGCIVLQCAVSGVLAAECRVVENGQASAVIVPADQAGPVELYACQELQRALHRISGVKLRIGNAGKEKYRIFVGVADHLPADAAASGKMGLADGGMEKYAVLSVGNDLILTGRTPRGALYAVYELLESQLGVRWLWPGDAGEFFPGRKGIVIQDVKITREPGFPYRGLHLCNAGQYDRDMEDWMLRNRMNILRNGENAKYLKERADKGFIPMISGHFARLPKNLMAAHPEAFALVNGKRIADQLCFSNPQTVALVADQIAGWWEKYPQLEIVNIYPSDNMDYCGCQECRKHDVSDLWFTFLGKLIVELDRRHPGGKYATIAYQGYKKVPKVKLPRLDFIEYCLYDMCYRHDFKCDYNVKAADAIRQWQRTGIPVTIYGYEFDVFRDRVAIPQEALICDEIKALKNMNTAGEITEIGWDQENPDSRITHRLALYVYARTLFDPSLKFEDLLKEWTDTAFGGAAEPMRDYYRLLEKAWSRSSKHVSYYLHNASGFAGDYLEPAEYAQAKQDLDKAMKLAAGQSRILEQIAAERRLLRHWEELRAAWIAAQAGMTVNVPQSADSAVRLPEFQGNGKFNPTRVSLSRDQEALYITCECSEPESGWLNSAAAERDGNVWLGECIELFLVTPEDKVGGRYSHLAVNAGGARYDAKSIGGMQFDKSWNPEWTAETGRTDQGWTARIRLPFSVFGSPDTDWGFAIKRSRSSQRKDLVNSGFPDASYHNLNGMAVLHFLKDEDRPQVLYLGPGRERAEMIASGEALKMKIAFPEKLAGLKPASDAKVKVIVIARNTVGLSQDFARKELLPWVEQGGTLVLFGGGRVDPVWCGGVGTPEWTGWKKVNEAVRVLIPNPGPWCTQPNQLVSQLKTRRTPASGFLMNHASGWESLAELTLKSGATAPWLIRRSVGKGMLYLSSGDMASGGGYCVFGDRDIKNLCLFLQNLVTATEQGK